MADERGGRPIDTAVMGHHESRSACRLGKGAGQGISAAPRGDHHGRQRPLGARSTSMAAAMGHRQGVEALREIIRHTDEPGH